MIGSGIMRRETYMYKLHSEPGSEVLDLSVITSTETTQTCPPLEVNIVNEDDTDLDPDLFTFVPATMYG